VDHVVAVQAVEGMSPFGAARTGAATDAFPIS
jgi:hypothetical protein